MTDVVYSGLASHPAPITSECLYFQSLTQSTCLATRLPFESCHTTRWTAWPAVLTSSSARFVASESSITLLPPGKACRDVKDREEYHAAQDFRFLFHMAARALFELQRLFCSYLPWGTHQPQRLHRSRNRGPFPLSKMPAALCLLQCGRKTINLP